MIPTIPECWGVFQVFGYDLVYIIGYSVLCAILYVSCCWLYMLGRKQSTRYIPASVLLNVWFNMERDGRERGEKEEKQSRKGEKEERKRRRER